MNDIPVFKDSYKDKNGKPIIPDLPYGPCPFCGQEDKGSEYMASSIWLMESNRTEIMGNEVWYIECKSCGARGSESCTPLLAVEVWNESTKEFLICPSCKKAAIAAAKVNSNAR